MKYPAHTDPRAYQYFTCGFVGRGHGDVEDHECAKNRSNGTECPLCVRGGEKRAGHSTNFDNGCGLASTATISCDRDRHYCAYCGNRAHVLQDRKFHVTGHTCSCAGACDEREWIVQWNAMADRHSDEEVAMKKLAPKQSAEVLAAVFQRQSQSILQDIREGRQPHALERLGILVNNDPTE